MKKQQTYNQLVKKYSAMQYSTLMNIRDDMRQSIFKGGDTAIETRLEYRVICDEITRKDDRFRLFERKVKVTLAKRGCKVVR